MQVDVLGPVEVHDNATSIAIGGPRQRAVLAVLALLGGTAVPIEQLADAVWAGAPPRTADHTLHNYVLRLRRAGLAIERVDDGYRLDSPTDAGVLRAAVESARAMGATNRASTLGEALTLVRGEPGHGLADTDVVRAPRAGLVEVIESAREDAADARLELAADTAAAGRLIADLRGLVATAPYREQRWELLVRGLYRAGRQSEALDAYAEARDLLARELGIDPSPGLRKLQQAVLSQDPALSTANVDPTTPPAVAVGGRALPGLATRLVGRADELAAVRRALSASRLVSVVGPLGAGKTRLALEFARAAAESVWFVPLEGLAELTTVAESVLSVVAPTSRASDAADGVVSALADSTGILILDAAEQRVNETTALVTRLLSDAPTLQLLVTTRQRLRLRDEAVVTLDPLTVPDRRALLIDRARLSDPGFTVDPSDIEMVDRLCDLLDGLPLGIELVARHLRLMSIRELTDRVDADLDRWTEGATEGSAGLVSAVAATVAAVDPALREVLARLSVFPAEVDLALAHQVVAPDVDEDAMFDALATLVDRSLLQVRSGRFGVRYAMLLSVRRYSLSLLDEAARRDVEQAYVSAVLRRSERLATALRSPDRAATVFMLDADAPHLRAALASSLDGGEPVAALRVATALADYWLARQPREGMAWLSRLLDAAPVTGVERAAVLLQMGHLAYWLTDFDRGSRLLEEARVLLDGDQDPLLLGRVLRRMGAIDAARDDVDSARERFQESLAVLRDSAADTEAAISALHLGSLLADESRTEEALPLLVRARDSLRAAGDPLQEGHALSALSLAWWKSGDLVAALGAGEQALARFRDLGQRPSEGVVAYRLASICRGLELSERARRYAELALTVGSATGTRTTISLAHLALARLDLDDAALHEAASHLTAALVGLDVTADRWVLAEALEATGRLQLAHDRPAAGVLAAAAELRELIGQPAPPADAAEIAALAQAAGDRTTARSNAAPSASDAAGLRAWALDLCWSAVPAIDVKDRAATAADDD